MIYSRFGDPCTIARVATLADVTSLDKRKPDKHDKQRVADGCYLVTKSIASGTERLHDVCYLRADEGSLEITRAVRALGTPEEEILQSGDVGTGR
jgi:hypothetical protein